MSVNGLKKIEILYKNFIIELEKEEGDSNMKIGIKEISERTGYSVATVSNALNHKRGVNMETSSRIFHVAMELGYINSAHISKIRFVTYKKNGLVIDDTPFFSAIIDGVEREAKSSGYETLFCTLDRSSETYEEQAKAILNDMSSGVLLLGTEMTEDDFALYKDAKCPLVLLDSWCDSYAFDSILISNSDSAANAARYLMAKGHKRIGYLKSKFRIKNFSYRASGFHQALRKGGLSLDAHDVVPLLSTIHGAYRDMNQWLSTAGSLPTAFFADNDVIALGALRAMKERGLHVPRDVSLIGFDDLMLGEASSPRLTTIHVYKQEMGQLAVRRLVELIKNNGGRAKVKTQVCTELVERESVLDLNKD